MFHAYVSQPAYFVYLLRSFCLSPTGRLQIKNFLSLANAVIAVFVTSLGPFMLMGQIPQLLSRLFPFKRGLNHAYWAPNVWALVTALDRVLLRCALALHAMISYCLVSAPLTSPSDVQRTGAEVTINDSGVASSSRGLVGDTVFAVLPNVQPIHTFIITIAFQIVSNASIWRRIWRLTII